MKTINEGNSNICMILGKQEIKVAKYRLMKYLLDAESNEGILLQNTITGQMVLLNAEEESLIKNLPDNVNENMKPLVESFFLVPEDYNEKQTVLQLREIMKKLFNPKGIKSYTILTTTNCNARCFYCYENELPHFDMNESTANKLVEYIEKHKGEGAIELHWFGGEPLIREDRISQICNSLKDRGIKYVSRMTSNGYLFTKDLIEKAATQWKLNSVQITLDGTEEIYNNTKKYIHAEESPYQRVLNNIQDLLAQDIHVIIRLNLDKHNMQDLWKLADELNTSIKDFEKINVYTHVLFEDAGFMPIKRNDESRALLYNSQVELNKHLKELGLYKGHKGLPFLKTHNCMADTDNAIAVFPDGKLFKCEHVQKGDEVGNIKDDIYIEQKRDKYLVTAELDECGECPIYPSCILLENCQGKKDKNRFTCRYDIELYRQSLVGYHRSKTMCNSDVKELPHNNNNTI